MRTYFSARPGVVSSQKLTTNAIIMMLPRGCSAMAEMPGSINIGRDVDVVGTAATLFGVWTKAVVGRCVAGVVNAEAVHANSATKSDNSLFMMAVLIDLLSDSKVLSEL
jgi:hypothetical protein